MSIVLSEIQDFPWYTTTVLAASATFTGAWKRVHYIPLSTETEIPVSMPWARYVSGLVMADQTGTVRVDQSNDGTTVHFRESFVVGIGLANAVGFLRRIYGSWVRVTYVNDATLQGSFSLFALVINGV